MPVKAERRHQYWTVDLRYLDHQLGGGNVYCISIVENYSRAILAKPGDPGKRAVADPGPDRFPDRAVRRGAATRGTRGARE
jgi:hypothetical protein